VFQGFFDIHCLSGDQFSLTDRVTYFKNKEREVRMSHKYRDTRSVVLSEQYKLIELEAFREICWQFPIQGFAFRKGVVSPNHDVLAVSFSAQFEGKPVNFLVDITPSINYPNEEPGGILIEPDISWVPRGEIRLHVYDDLEGRLLCAHVMEWTPRATMAKFFMNAVYPWANNFVAWTYTNGLWAPDLWNKTVNK